MADAMAAESRVVGRENIMEPAAPEEAEMRRRHSVADHQRRKMADRAKPGRAHHFAVKALDAGRRQEIRRRGALVLSALELEQALRNPRRFGSLRIDDEARLANLAQPLGVILQLAPQSRLRAPCIGPVAQPGQRDRMAAVAEGRAVEISERV